MLRPVHGRFLLAITLCCLANSTVRAEVINLTVAPSSSLNLTFSLPEVMRSTTVSRTVTGSLTENLTFGTVAGFGTVATAGQLQSGSLSLVTVHTSG